MESTIIKKGSYELDNNQPGIMTPQCGKVEKDIYKGEGGGGSPGWLDSTPSSAATSSGQCPGQIYYPILCANFCLSPARADFLAVSGKFSR